MTFTQVLFLVGTVNEKRQSAAFTVVQYTEYIFNTITGNHDKYNNWPVIDHTKQLNR